MYNINKEGIKDKHNKKIKLATNRLVNPFCHNYIKDRGKNVTQLDNNLLLLCKSELI